MNKLIPVLFLLNAFAAHAKAPADTDLSAHTDLRTVSTPSLKSLASRGYGGDGGSAVHFYYDITLGYASVKATGPTAFKKGGFAYSGEIGAKFRLRARRDYAQNLLAIGVGGVHADASKLVFGLVTLPITYTHMGFIDGAESGGLYVQIGVIPNYVQSVKDHDGNDLTKQFNNLFFEPTASIGLHTRFTLVKHGREVGGGRVFIGPYFAYGIGNLSKITGETITGYKLGFRWSYLF